MGSTGFTGSNQVFTKVNWVLPGFTGFYSVLLRGNAHPRFLLGFYLVVMSWTEFY